MHKIEMSPEILARIPGFRDGLHMFGNIDPSRTAHVIVDLQNGFMEPGATVELPVAREIVPNVNKICEAVRAAGGINVFIRYLIDEETQVNWSSWFSDFASPQRRKAMVETFSKDCHGFELWPELDVQPTDLIVDKTRFGAFVPGSSKLHEILQARGIDTLIITGTATNVCCESTARDAMQMNYKIIFVADGNAALTDAEHNATLNNMVTLFADVMTTSEVVGFLAVAANKRQAAA
ncbi:isochorismatase family cysteine hydrolase [Bradyrhizobium sp. dw_78]|uniref:cysteine hydrolase family protein n=1 Tax=Bradyrhizobium sp. dw_78 TaxID=2719793 RepID=UPI001BD4D82D|nr:isochorismatase family cysteine hydrolase [Bradyrhizobium sp. dw_78]